MRILNYLGIEISINRKNIKNLYLRIDPFNGKVQISAPYFVPDKIIKEFLERKSEWLKEKLKYIESRSLKFRDNEIFEIFGKKLKVTVKESNKPEILLSEEKLQFNFPLHFSIEKKEKFFEKWQREVLKKEADKFVRKWENNTKIRVNELKIRKMKSKWGSCNIEKRKITLNLALIKKPVICLEYVIVHEFVHFFEKYHNKNFYNILSNFFPKWEIAENLLKL